MIDAARTPSQPDLREALDVAESFAWFLFQLGYPYDLIVRDSDNDPVIPPIAVMDRLVRLWAEHEAKDLTDENVEDYRASFAIEIGFDPWDAALASQPAPAAVREPERVTCGACLFGGRRHTNDAGCERAILSRPSAPASGEALRVALAHLDGFFGQTMHHLANWRANAIHDRDTGETFAAHPSAILALLDVVDAAYASTPATPPAPESARPEGLDELRALSEAATPGPWRQTGTAAKPHWYIVSMHPDGALVHGNIPATREDYHPDTVARWTADAAFIAAAVNYVRAALAPTPTGDDQETNR